MQMSILWSMLKNWRLSLINKQLTTQQLADKFKVKRHTLSDTYSKFGSFKGYEQVGKIARNVRIWEFKGL